MASSLLSELRFGSFLVYSPRGTSPVSVGSRKYCYAVKAGHSEALARVIDRLVTDFSSTGLSAVLGPDVTLVPAPRSSVLVAGGLWPTRLIADALVAARLGSSVLPALTRTTAVPKSSFQARGERPNAKLHYETIAVELGLATSRITIVDDVLTKGNTLLGAATRLTEGFPNADIAAFGLIRTMGLIPDVTSIVEPCVGTIRRPFDDEAQRTP